MRRAPTATAGAALQCVALEVSKLEILIWNSGAALQYRFYVIGAPSF
ncbi:hypothetical protein Ga0080574_TMP3373 [Salipiger abyssi]|uniref:Uncharacterized protein n=1 Tax=Salipiger abyssi TaxID=1250539 RepID=A0A1P8UWD2_9RHOB|nr:hypothetical protein Ga0080574_TMP3373 [Salipiger abyssi]